MSFERVSVVEGKKPIIIIAPHGYQNDDENTSVIAENIAKILDCYAVINRGWQRSNKVDIFNDFSDCNNAEHCHKDVVKEEFLDPILRFRNRLRKKFKTVYVFLIHGMSNKHRSTAHDQNMDIVVGYGAGSPNSFSCDIWRKNAFIHFLGEAGITAYEGKKGGAMSGWARSNMNQLFRKWYSDPNIQSMQIEIVHDLRTDFEIASLTAEYLALAMNELLKKSKFDGPNNDRKY